MVFIYWFAYAFFSAICEAVFWSRYRGTNPKGLHLGNAHVWLVMQRVAVGAAMYSLSGEWQVMAFFVFSFSLWHDGIYYQFRNLLDKDDYPRGFFDYSTTSTAFYTNRFWVRLLTAILGAGFFFI